MIDEIHPEDPWSEVKVLEVLAWSSYSTPPTPASVTFVHPRVLVVPGVTPGSANSVGTGGARSSWVELTKADHADCWPKASLDLTRYQ